MKNTALYLLSFLLLTPSSVLLGQIPAGQIPLNPAPTRVVGQNGLFQSSLNLVEGREFNQPSGIALDLNLSPPALYVADTANHRVLGFRNATSFNNGQKADIVIGQVDFQSTSPQGPRGPGLRNTGLTAPSGLTVDGANNLYIVDSGNNRVLRFPTPFSQTDVLQPDLVFGQPSFATRDPNLNGISASTLSFANPDPNHPFLEAFLAFDSTQNLWVADPANNRVLRYPAASLNSNPLRNGPAADLVLGQLDFASNSVITTGNTNLNFLIAPTGVAFDREGRLFISESQVGNTRSRILIYSQQIARNGQAATRLLGVVPTTVVPQPPFFSEQQFSPGTGALFIINDGIGIADAGSNRLLAFKPVDQFSANVLTQQAQSQYLFGQTNFSTGLANQGMADTGPDRLFAPQAVAVSGTELFIADTGNNRVIAVPYSSVAVGQASRVLGQDSLSLNGPNLVEGREFRFTSGGMGRQKRGLLPTLSQIRRICM